MNNGRKRNESAYEISNGGVRAAGTRGLSGRAGGLLHGGTKSREAAQVVHQHLRYATAGKYHRASCPRCGKVFKGRSVGAHVWKCGVTPQELFWHRVDKNGPGGCWLYMGSRKPNGYGHMLWSGKDLMTHRYSWEAANGPIPEGMHVLHRCDVPYCVNPAHLFLGTHAENMRDAKAKGRNARGERTRGAKLTDELVLKLRARYKKSGPRRSNIVALARECGVTKAAAYFAATRRTWKHLP